MNRRILIGIDTGINTGFSVYDANAGLKIVTTLKIHVAMSEVLRYRDIYGLDNIFVRFEDARQRRWFGNSGREQLQGAGSIKRDCNIWEDFLEDNGIAYEAVAPVRNKTKLSQQYFEKITGWTKRTNEHARDAAMLVFKYNLII